MFSWLSRMFSSVAGRIDNTVRGWVNDVIGGVYGYIHAIFTAVGAEWAKLSTWTGNLYYQIHDVLDAIYRKIFWIIRQAIPFMVQQYYRLVNDATTFTKTVLDYASKGITWVTHYAEHLVHDAVQWVTDNVWNPLQHLISQAWDWITHTGATIADYIAHPDKLAALIFDSLLAIIEREAWSVAEKLGRFFIVLIVKNLRQFVMLVEDILDAIL